MNGKKRLRQNAFTLIEILVSVAIIAVLASVVTQSLFTTVRTNTKSEISKDVKQSGDFAIDTLARTIQNARQVTSACEIDGTGSTEITIMGNDGGLTTMGCVQDGSATRIASVSAAGTSYLTGNSTTLGGDICAASSLQFKCTGVPGLPQKVEISFNLAQLGTPVDQFEKASGSFSSTTVLRNEEH